MPCEFCDRTWRGDLVFEDDTVWVVLHEDWSVRGHAMVIPKSHVLNLSDMNPREAMRYSASYRRAETILMKVTETDRAIMLKLGIVTPHLHLHIYPVAASLDRAAVMAIIDGKVSVPRDEAFVERVRQRLNDFRES